jgi:hypothetical protein
VVAPPTLCFSFFGRVGQAITRSTGVSR